MPPSNPSPLDAVPFRLAALPSGQRLTLVGLDSAALRVAVEASPATARQMLDLDLRDTRSTGHVVTRILDDLAALALALWPRWSDSTRTAETLASWRQEAARLAAAGQPPRFRRMAPRVEFRQLLAAVDPDGLILVATLDPAEPRTAAARIAALEWCAGAGASIAILCPTRPPAVPPFDRVLYGALEVTRPVAPVLSRLFVPQGRAHPASETEARLQAALLRDAELGPLFAYNICVTTHAPGFTPRVDLVWDEGRVVVELDGPEHQGDPKFGHDRHRDYELLIAGYLVLRLTNAQVATDLHLAVEKIRKVVRYRRFEGGSHD